MEFDRVNLSDPDAEPTDAQLEGLMKRAFAGVGEQDERLLAERRAAARAQTATLRAELRAKYPSAFFR